MSEKTHQPTSKKLEDAKKKGQIPRSKLFTSAAVTMGGLAGTFLFATESAARLMTYTRSLLGTHIAPDAAIDQGWRLLAQCSAPTLAGAMLGALGSTLAQSGLQMNTDAVMPKLDKLNFIEGAKKLFSVRQLIDVLKGLAVALIIFWLMWSEVRDHAAVAFAAVHHDGAAAFIALLTLLKPVVLKTAVVLLVLGVADWALAKKRHIKDLMMSHEEVKQEHKNSEGDPHQKSKMKSMRKQLANGGAARGVKKASAIVVNPTHIAVALRYADDECDAPYIVAKGQEEDALKIRKEAADLGIPVIRDIPLARSLIHYDVGEEVPEELYQAAAAILKVALEQTEGAQS